MAAPDPELAVWPVALALGWAAARARGRLARLRDRAAEGMHELRRPLQALALVAGHGLAVQHVDAAADALAELEDLIAGRQGGLRPRSVVLRPIVEAAVQRWDLGRSQGEAPVVELRWLAGNARVVADPLRIARAIDNLIANALEHGRSPAVVEVARSPGGLRLSVRNRIGAGVREPARIPPWNGRRGHGLRIVSKVAADHGGRFLFDCERGWAVGTIELPLPRPVPEAVAGA